jgi:hypothetical protein
LRRAPQTTRHDDSLTNWNDEPGRTRDDVMDTLEAATTSAAAKLGNRR